jgi:hypothetical protein
MAHSATATASRHHGHSIGFNLGVIGLIVAAVAVGVAYLLNAADRPNAPVQAPSDAMLARTIGSTALTIPASWIAEDGSDDASFARQVDLVVTLPLGPNDAPRRIEVTLTQRSRVRPSASLLDGVYLHEFKPDQLSGPPGLIGKPLVAEDGFESETVWYDPLNSSPFVAKCDAPIAPGQPGRCLRTVYLDSGIALVYTFDDDVLGAWRKFDAEMHPLLAKIGAV